MNKLIVLQSDFGLSDGAVSAMYGVIKTVDRTLSINDLTHQIPQFNIWEASYRLLQTVHYWPSDTIFVSIVDPGVGSRRRSVVARLSNGQLIVTPDNGTLTHLAHTGLIEKVRIIDETKNRLPNSGESHTFHGRDIFAYTAARLASGHISFADIGKPLAPEQLVQLDVAESYQTDEALFGTIDIIDRPFGNLWTNIERKQFVQFGARYGEAFELSISHHNRDIYRNYMTYSRTFAELRIGEPLLYVNSLDHIGIGINQGSFAGAYAVGTGTSWKVVLRRPSAPYKSL
ncbi:SAM hydrolase/SAM-dependent halogenase family protein [Listeria costaricensis]|uniref:SAM hydrolase/SAM-dependent halogenase family protein n=1 Tax=Listeria costaricensis TaxID=2026604 RepID=UPI000C071DE0|nr:S-adenosyl-l-methionine hydroxide adenosyltransferase family protein [Listeria costaricensis]